MYVKLKSVVARAKMMLSLKTTEHDESLMVYANEWIRGFRTQETFPRKVKEVEVKNSLAKVPCDFYEYVGITFANCQNVVYYSDEYVDNPQTVDSKVNLRTPDTVSLDGDYLNFGSVIVDDVADLTYRGMRIDKDGDVIVHDMTIYCGGSYVAAQFCGQVGVGAQYEPHFDKFLRQYDRSKKDATGYFAQRDAKHDRYKIAALNHAAYVFNIYQ